MKDNVPRFIVDKPQGEDVFEGQSQTKLAKNISDYILSADKEEAEKDDPTCIPRIIGIEGSWGAGKSTFLTTFDFPAPQEPSIPIMRGMQVWSSFSASSLSALKI